MGRISGRNGYRVKTFTLCFFEHFFELNGGRKAAKEDAFPSASSAGAGWTWLSLLRLHELTTSFVVGLPRVAKRCPGSRTCALPHAAGWVFFPFLRPSEPFCLFPMIDRDCSSTHIEPRRPGRLEWTVSVAGSQPQG